MIIGMTGSIAAGKETLTGFLRKRGFRYFITSDLLKDELNKRGAEITRENMQNLGDELRGKHGAEVLMKMLLKKIDVNENSILDSIRNPKEAEFLRDNLDNFILIAIDAPREIRFKRMLERGKPSDPKTWEDFLKTDERDKSDPENPLGQQVGKCIDIADHVLINDRSLEEMERKMKDLFGKIYTGEQQSFKSIVQYNYMDRENNSRVNLENDETYVEKVVHQLNSIFEEHVSESEIKGKDLFEHWKRPKWDDYFMSMAILVSMRSIDPSQKNGCIIVDKNNKILSVGYNGFPRNSIDELIPLKRPDKYLFIEHAEKNAILNRQFSIEGSTLYVTSIPCLACMRSIIQSGVKRVVYLDTIISRNISKDDMAAISRLMVGRTDLTLEKFDKDPLSCLYKSIEYYQIKKVSKKKRI